MNNYLKFLAKLYLVILVFTLVCVNAFSQPLFSEFFCYNSPDAACFDITEDGVVDVHDMLLILPWYGNNHFGAEEMLLLAGQYGNPSVCDLYDARLDTYNLMFMASSGALFYYPVGEDVYPVFGILQYTMEDEGESANPYICNLLCLKSFIYTLEWSDGSSTEYAFRNYNPIPD